MIDEKKIKETMDWVFAHSPHPKDIFCASFDFCSREVEKWVWGKYSTTVRWNTRYRELESAINDFIFREK